MSGADEVYDLARDFTEASSAVASALYDAFKDGGEGFRDDWRHNVQASSPQGHLKHLPDAITTETRLAFGIEVVTGPERGRRQGALGRGDEFGSKNQPAHLNGLRAMPLAERRIDRLSDAAIGLVLP